MSRSRWVLPALIYSVVLITSCVLQWWAQRDLSREVVFALVALNAAMAFGIASALEVVQYVHERYPAQRRFWSWALMFLSLGFSLLVAYELVGAVAALKTLGHGHVLAGALTGGMLVTLNAIRPNPYGNQRLNSVLAAVLLLGLLVIQDRYRMLLRDARYSGVSAAFLVLTGLTALRVFERLFAPRESNLRSVASVVAPFALFVGLACLSSNIAVRQLYFAALIPGRMVFSLYLPQQIARSWRGDARDNVAYASAMPARVPIASLAQPAPVAGKARPDPADFVVFALLDTVRYDAFKDYLGRPDSKLAPIWRESCVATAGYSPSSATARTLRYLSHRPGTRNELWLETLRHAGVQTALVMDESGVAYLDRQMPFRWSQQFDMTVRLKRNADTPYGLESVAGSVRTVIARQPAPRFIWAHFYEVHQWSIDDPEATRIEYDKRVAQVGDEIATLTTELVAAGKKFTLMIVSDHGEGIDHFSTKNHDNFLYEPLVRVPFMLWTNAHPCSAEATALREFPAVTTTVVGPLVLEELGIASDPLLPTPVQLAREPVYMQTAIQQAVLRWPHKLIVSPWFSELFDLEADPNERNDLIDTESRTVAELMSLLDHQD